MMNEEELKQREREIEQREREIEFKDLALAVKMLGGDIANIRRTLEAILGFLEGIVVEPFAPSGEQSEDESELPIDFPYREDLAAAGIYTIAQIPRTAKQLKRIDGVDHDAVVPIIRAVTNVAAKENK